MKKILAIILSILVLCASLPMMAVAAASANDDTPTFVASEAYGRAGDYVSVDVWAYGNPGLLSLKLKIDYDSSVLELMDYEEGVFEGLSVGSMSETPFIVNWLDSTFAGNETDGVATTLVFRIKDDAVAGVYPVSVSYDQADVYDIYFEEVYFEVQDGFVEVLPCEHLNTKTETTEYVDATCTEDGYYTTVTYCTDCGEELSGDGDIIEAKGHNVDENNVCLNCGEIITYPAFVVSQTSGIMGETVSVTVSTINNPGIISSKLNIGYDESVLQLESVEEADFAGLEYGPTDSNPIVINWANGLEDNNATDGVLAVLNFVIKDGAPEGVTPITVTYDPDDVFDYDLDNVYFEIENGSVEVFGCQHETQTIVEKEHFDGTCVEDGYVVTAYVCGLCGIEVDSETTYTKATGHKFTLQEEIPASCTTTGRRAYLYCTGCKGDYAIDADIYTPLNQTISYDELIIPYTHSVNDDGICSICGEEVFINPTFVVSEATGRAGDTVTVDIAIKNNPGIVSFKLYVTYDLGSLELIDCSSGVFSRVNFGNMAQEPFVINWVDTVNGDNDAAGTIATLTFKIKDGADAVEYGIGLHYNPDDIYNENYDSISFDVRDGVITVLPCEHENIETVTTEYVAPTCTEDGYYTTVTYCTDCGAELSGDGDIIKATGHRLGADGICKNCGEQLTVPSFVVSEERCKVGNTVTITVSTVNNSGIVSMLLQLGYDSNALEVISVDGADFSGVFFGPTTNNPIAINWVDGLNGNNTTDGVVAQITFKVKENATEGNYPITLTYAQEDVFDDNLNDVYFNVQNGSIEVYYCDHTKQTTVTENFFAADCVNNGSYDMVAYCDDCGNELARTTVIIKATGHEFVAVDEVLADCTHIGIKAHMHCKVCEKNFDLGADGFVDFDYALSENDLLLPYTHEADANGKCVLCGNYVFTAPTFVVEGSQGYMGNTVEVKISIVNNPGIVSAKLKVAYDSSVLELVDNIGEGVYGPNTSFGAITKNPFTVNWIDTRSGNNYTDNGEFVTLVFKIKDGAQSGVYPITITYDQADIYNTNYEDIYFDIHNGSIEVIECAHTNTYTTTENSVDTDCVTNSSYDTVVYCYECGNEVSRETIVIPPTGHRFVFLEGIDSTCTALGHIPYNYCTVCHKNFAADADIFTSPQNSISNAEIVLPYGHIADVNGKCVLCNNYIFTESTVVVSSAQGYAGKQVEVKLSLVNNPGIVSFLFEVAYDPNILELVRYKGEGVFANNMSFGLATRNPFKVNWVDTIHGDYINNGEVATLVFKIKDGAQLGSTPITVTYDQNNIFNTNYEDVYFDIHNGSIEVVECSHEQITVKNENTVDATCLTNGKYDKVTYCADCGEELSRQTIIVDALGHTEGSTVEENYKAPTCEAKGSYDSVVYCNVCGEELSRETVVVDALGHTEKTIRENEKSPTCENTGSYDSVVYCTVCGEELSRETVVIDALGHTEAKPEKENYEAPTCENTGSYDNVVYCTVCGKELSRQTVIVDALGHTEDSAVEENYKAPTCAEKGSYDSVVYCAVCKKELSRKTIEIATIPHTTGETVIENVELPGCEHKGSYDSVKYCTVCTQEVSRETTYTAYGHKIDANGECTECSAEITQPIFYVTGGKALKGNTFTVSVALKNNPGIISMKLLVGYDVNVFELVSAEGGNFTNVDFGPTANQPFVINWVDALNPNNTADGVVATLTFNVKEDTELEETLITVDYDEEDVYDCNFENVYFDKNYTVVEVADYTPGDVNDDGRVNNKDLGMLMQHLNGWEVDINVNAADVNADGRVNNKDYGVLMQYCNGWEIELK